MELCAAGSTGRSRFVTKAEDGFEALVSNTMGRGPCPDEEFDAIDVGALPADVGALAAEHGCDLVWRNPRRFWMFDVMTIDLVG